VASDLRFMIDKRFADDGIVIAFPQRDVRVDPSRPIRVEMVARAAATRPCRHRREQTVTTTEGQTVVARSRSAGAVRRRGRARPLVCDRLVFLVVGSAGSRSCPSVVSSFTFAWLLGMISWARCRSFATPTDLAELWVSLTAR
jgi:hypothetical protein